MAKRVSFKTPSRLTTVLLGRRHYPQICKLLTLCFSHLAGPIFRDCQDCAEKDRKKGDHDGQPEQPALH